MDADVYADDESGTPRPAAPKVKKPLFKRRAKVPVQSPPPEPTPGLKGLDALARRSEEDEDLELFKRSKDFFPTLLEEQRAGGRNDRSQDRKRRKLSHDDSDSDLYNVSDRELERLRKEKSNQPRSPSQRDRAKTPAHGDAVKSPPSSVKKLDKGKGLASPHSLSSPSKSARSASSGWASADKVVTLSDSDDNDGSARRRRKAHAHSPSKTAAANSKTNSSNDVGDDSDIIIVDQRTVQLTTPEEEEETPKEQEDSDEPIEPEYARYVAAAKERRAAQKAAELASSRGNGHAKGLEDPAVRIVITSRLGGPEMKPIAVARRISGPFKPVRETLINLAGSRGRELTEHEKESLFLTWKGTRLYDSASISSLGVMPDANGVFNARRGAPSLPYGNGFMQTNLHLEAWTDESFEAHRIKVERQRRRDLGELLSSDDEEGAGRGAGKHGVQDEAPKIRVILKSKNLEPLKMSTQPDTTVFVLVSAFRKQRLGDTPEKEISLYWDGEKLDEDATIKDVEIEDMETIEVHIK